MKRSFDAIGEAGRTVIDIDIESHHIVGGGFVGSGFRLDLADHIAIASGTGRSVGIVVGIAVDIVAAGVYSFVFADVGAAVFVAKHHCRAPVVAL